MSNNLKRDRLNRWFQDIRSAYTAYDRKGLMPDHSEIKSSSFDAELAERVKNAKLQHYDGHALLSRPSPTA